MAHISFWQQGLCGYSQGFSGEGASNDSGVIETSIFRAFGRYDFGTLGLGLEIGLGIGLKNNSGEFLGT